MNFGGMIAPYNSLDENVTLKRHNMDEIMLLCKSRD